MAESAATPAFADLLHAAVSVSSARTTPRLNGPKSRDLTPPAYLVRRRVKCTLTHAAKMGRMYIATADLVLPTTITGSLPRPSWYTENLGIKSFLDAMVISRFREQYVDALSVYLRDQEVAGLDILTDGDCRFDQDVGGQSWTSYPPHHMDGFEKQDRSGGRRVGSD